MSPAIRIMPGVARAIACVAVGMLTTASQAAAPDAPLPPGMVRIFDGKSLDGWVQEPLNSTTFSGGDITDPAALAKRLTEKPDPVASFVADQLDDAAREALSAYAAGATKENARTLRSALSKNLTRLVEGKPLYDAARFKDVRLRDEARRLLKSEPSGRELARLNRVLLEDAFAKELWTSPAEAWTVRDGVIASLGAGRGVLHTKRSFDKRYRVIFDVKHVSGDPDHRAGVLVFCAAPNADAPPPDALAGIQFQVPNGGHWDYRKGHNDAGKTFFTRVRDPKLDEHQWSRVEILADPATGVARMAVAQPPGAKAVEVLSFRDPSAGRAGPFALQMHNRGLFDEYANVAVEENVAADELITRK